MGNDAPTSNLQSDADDDDSKYITIIDHDSDVGYLFPYSHNYYQQDTGIANLIFKPDQPQVLEKLSNHIKEYPDIINSIYYVEDEYKTCGTLLFFACKFCPHSSYDIIRLLIELGSDVNYKNNTNTTPLMYAVMWTGKIKHIHIVELLMEYGAKINDSNNMGNTPLIFACRNSTTTSSVECIEYLLNNGAHVNDQNESKTTPLMEVILNNHFEAAVYLVNKNADCKLINDQGRSVYDIIKLTPKNKNRRKLKMLLNCVSKKPVQYYSNILGFT